MSNGMFEVLISKERQEILKIHSKYQEIINKLCKEKTTKKTIYRTQ